MSAPKKHTVLIVDDVLINRALLSTVFDGMYEILEAEDGAEALSLLKQHEEIIAVVLDIVMPVMDGFAVLSAMRENERYREIPVLVVTGSDDEQSQIKALDLGAIDVISKPFNPKIVIARVKNAIERFIARKEASKAQLLAYKVERQQKELERSRYDALTGLYNKQFFYEETRRILNENPDKNFVIGRFDIDKFKVFNEVFGAARGDKLLADMGAFLKKNTFDFLIAAHIGADHFAAMFDADATDKEQLTNAIQEWYDAYPVKFDFAVKAGFYPIVDRDVDTIIMCDRALLAIRSVKNAAGMQMGVYSDSLRQTLLAEQALLSDMNLAFEQEQFRVWYQPQYDYVHGCMSGAEALVRWIHPERGIVSPGQFIPIMERNGIITRLDEYVWERCCQDLRRWINLRGEKIPPISTNISRADLLRSDLADVIVQLTEKYDVPRNLLNLEITESAYMDDSELLLSTVKKLRSLGFTVEMDDFGSGYSSLNTLKDVPVDILKLDMKFISGSQQTARGGNILSSIVRMARWLELPVIAEGVETREQADFLKSIGCRLMQGYYFARPMPVDSFEPLYLSENTKLPVSTNADFSQVSPFLDATSQTALLFNSFLGGAAILESHHGNVEMLRANDRFFDIIGTDRGQFAPYMNRVQDCLENGYRQLLSVKLDEAGATNEEVEFECACKNLDGDLIWLAMRIKNLGKTADSAIFYTSIDNITDKKNNEREVRKQDMLLKLLFNAVPSGILRFRDEENLIPRSYNEAVWKQLRFKSEKQFLQSKAYTDIFSMVFSDDKQKFDKLFFEVKNGRNGASAELTHRIVADDGSVNTVHSTFQKVTTDNGESYLQIVFSDVTGSKETEALRYGKALLKVFDEVLEVNFNNMTYTVIREDTDEILPLKDTTTLDKLMISRVNSIVHPDDREKLISKFIYLNRTHPNDLSDLPRLDYRILKQDGGFGWHSLLLMYVTEGRYLCCIADASKEAEKNADLMNMIRNREKTQPHTDTTDL